MNWRRGIIGLAIAIPLIALLGYGLTTDPRAMGTRTGAEANPFTLATLDGRDTVRLADYAGEIVVINFWGPWCPQCSLEHDDLSAAARFYEGRGVHFLGVMFKDAPANGIDWIERHGGQAYPAIWDSDLRTSIDYGLRGAPETFVIGRDGRVEFHRRGVVTLEVLRAVIDPLLAAAPAGRGTAGAGRPD